jgi:hypothetical protein
LIGGSGLDEIHGESGDDQLYGRDGNDRLNGGSGNDGLYGGSEKDSLTGGTGSDRFLRYNGGGTITDADWNADVQIIFSSRNLPWEDREVEVVDQAFAQLHDRVNGSTWIFNDTVTGDPLVFTKVRKDSLGEGVLGSNRLSWNPLDSKRQIDIVDWNASSHSENDLVRRVVIHEIAHNWDAPGLPFVNVRNPYWGAFESLHAQSRKMDTSPLIDHESSDFARDYGQANSDEDWATTWELFFRHIPGPSQRSDVLQQKLLLVSNFFSLPSDWLG